MVLPKLASFVLTSVQPLVFRLPLFPQPKGSLKMLFNSITQGEILSALFIGARLGQRQRFACFADNLQAAD